MEKIFDIHSHYIPPNIAEHTTFFKVHWSDIDRQLEVMDKNGIEKSLLLYPTTDAHLSMGGLKKVCRVYNDAIGAVVKKFPARFIGAGILPIESSADMYEELNRFKDLDLKCISLASSYDGKYLDDEIFFDVYDFAGKHNIPIHVHPQIINPIGELQVKDPLLTPVFEYLFDVSICIGKMIISGVFNRFSDVKFIFAHYGGVLPFVKERLDNTYVMLRKRGFVKDLNGVPSQLLRNIYLDISGSKSIGALQCALELTDLSHIVWGSDFPANQNISESISLLSNSILSEAQLNAFSRRNFISIFSL